MDLNLEVFYGEDEQAKISHMDKIFRVFQAQVAKNEILKTSRLHFKAFARVLADDYKKSPELTLSALRNMHIILKNVDLSVRQEIVEENPVDVFLLTCSKVFSWEFRRLGRIYTRYCESILHKEGVGGLSTDDLNRTRGAEAEGELARRQGSQSNGATVKENQNPVNDAKTAGAKGPAGAGAAKDGARPVDSREQKILRTMNINLLKQTKMFTLIVLIIKEYVGFICDSEPKRLAEFQNYFLALGTAEHLARCLDYEDPALIKSVILLLTEVHNEKIVMALLDREVLTRLSRFVNNKDCQFVVTFIFEVLKFPKARERLTGPFLKEVVAGLEKGNIANALAVLNLLSLEKGIQKTLLELEVPNLLVNVALACFKKDDKKDGKKLLWNVLINLATQAEAVHRFLSHPALPAFFDFAAQTKNESCFKFLENLFWFSDDAAAKQRFAGHANFFLEFLETADDTDAVRVPAAIGLLGDLYQGKERRPITLMMKLVKRPGAHNQTHIAIFNFLNKALYGMPNCPDLVNGHVAEYSLKHFFVPDRKMDNEARFQFLFFVHNLVALRRQRITLAEFVEYVDGFDFVNVRLVALVMNCFDAFLSVALWHKESTAEVFKRKTECFRSLLQKVNQGGADERFYEEAGAQFR